MDLLRQQLAGDIKEISEKYVNELTDKWELLFDLDKNESLRLQLKSHLESFFTTILNETNDKINYIKKLISEESKMEEKLNKSLEISYFYDLSCSNLSLYKQLNALKKRIMEKKSMLIKRNETEILQLQLQINKLINILEIDDSNENKALLSKDIEPTDVNVEKLRNLKSLYDTKFEKLEIRINDMKATLGNLWTYCEISEKEQSIFLNLPNNQSTIYLLTKEINRCEEEKAAKLEKLIDEKNYDIAQYKVKCLIEEEPKVQKSKIISEKVLHQLEDELNNLKQYYEKNMNIIECIQEREVLQQYLRECDSNDSVSDPMAKFRNRGGELLKKLKQRKINAKKLQTIEEELVKSLLIYEQKNGKKFKVFGEDFEMKSTKLKYQACLQRSDSKIVKNLKLKPLGDVTNLRE